MSDQLPEIHRALARLRRPPLLVRAARFGVRAYRRDAALPHLLGPGPVPPVPQALASLLEIERTQDAARRGGALTYRAADHVALLIAVMAEAELLAAQSSTAPTAQPNASGIPSLRVAT